MASADELFSPSTDDPNPYIAFVELEEGKYLIRLTARSVDVGIAYYAVEKYR